MLLGEGQQFRARKFEVVARQVRARRRECEPLRREPDHQHTRPGQAVRRESGAQILASRAYSASMPGGFPSVASSVPGLKVSMR